MEMHDIKKERKEVAQIKWEQGTICECDLLAALWHQDGISGAAPAEAQLQLYYFQQLLPARLH